MSDPIGLVTTKPDSELASEYRERIEKLLTQLCDIVNEARVHGLRIGFQTQDTPMKKHVIADITVARYF